MTLLRWADANYTPPTAGMGASELNQTPLDVRQYTVAPIGSGPSTVTYPLAASLPVGVFAGVRAPLYSDDLLYRIHVTPGTFTLGNVVGSVTRTVSVWNALFRDTTLLSIAALNADGITLGGHPVPPLTFGALQDRDYTLTVGPNGPAGIAATYTFLFTGLEARQVTVFGNRAIAWTWHPNWQPAITERLEWLTDVIMSFNGRQQVRKLRAGARRVIELETLMSDADRRRMEMALFGWGARSWVMPVWWDGQPIAATLTAGALSVSVSTTNREFTAGAYGILVNGTNASEIVEILSFTGSAVNFVRPTASTWPAGTMFYPALVMQLDPSVRIERFTDSDTILRARFAALAPANVTAGTLPLYLGYPILDARALLPGSLTASYDRKLQDVDNATAYPFRDDEAGIPVLSQAYGWQATTRAEKGVIRALLYLLAGRFGAVWIPTFASDLRVVADIPNATANIDVENQKYALFAASAPGRNHLRIQRRNGSVTYHKITGSSEVSATVERLTVSPSITPALNAADVLQASFMQLHRQTSDAVEIGHFTGESFSVQTNFTGLRHDL